MLPFSTHLLAFYNISNDRSELWQWMFSHAQEHENIYASILSTGYVITHYPLDDKAVTTDWLDNHYQEHLSVAQKLNLSTGYDLRGLDMKSSESMGLWNEAHIQYHTDIANAL